MRQKWIAVGDQIVSNASNLLLLILVARTSTAEVFGRFAVGYATLSFAVGIWRTGFAYQAALRAADRDALRKEARLAVAAGILPSTVVAAAVWLVVATGPGAPSGLAFGLAVAGPFVLAQDLLRYVAVADGRAGAALWADCAWTLPLLVTLATSILTELSCSLVTGVWASGAVVSALLLMTKASSWPQFRGLGTWIQSSWRNRAHLALGGLIAAGSVPISAAFVAHLAGPDVTGGIAGASAFMAPANSLLAFLTLTLLARSASLPIHKRGGLFARAALGAGATTLLWGALLLLIPPQVGEFILGESWPLGSQAIPVIGVQYSLGVIAQCGALYLTSVQQSRFVLLGSVALGASRTLLAISAAALFGTVIAVAVGETAAMAIWLVATAINVRAVRRRRDESLSLAA